MELIFWHTAGYNPETKEHTTQSYHCLFRASADELDINIQTELFDRFRVSTDDKEAFIKIVTDKVREVIENAPNPFEK